ncbi:hypothetical protein Pla108_08280 [Botrimarina colliarenosi]|uniref:Uncharacterized protein n=1 Tax=Botrimarina colliarenosi TaxID=2528001 RepID=A0A5C6AL30_9BACT|nr:hypothetical protein [Botrimarina colliarenosi]TWT99885.1 hypothetical protein Pla108_08280 [Botrimarina colliarenosi]
MDALHWRIGIDEAGYGPNLGPLVVAATAWRTLSKDDLYESLVDAVTPTTPRGDERLFIADSKAVYAPKAGLAQLERAVYAAFGQPHCWKELITCLGADPNKEMAKAPWREGFDPPLPCHADPTDIAAGARRLREVSEYAGVATPRAAARLIFPSEFNRLVAEHGTKGAALSHVSIGLARRLYDMVIEEGVSCAFTFDKHGGRNRYGPLLQQHFPDSCVETLDEARPVSRYRSGNGLTFAFRTNGETELPVALASMTAKLLRELAMRGLNAFWTAHIPGLKPTAGYPVDAKRYKQAIAAKQAELGIEDHLLWRER